MRAARHLFTALAACMVVGSATVSFACDKDKASATAVTASTKAACSAAMAARCTPEMAAACKASMATAAAKSADHCAAMKAAMISASAGECSKSAATAVTASMGAKDACCMKGGSAAAAKAARATKGMRISASLVDGHCEGTGMAGIASRNLHDDCDACLDMALCSEALDAAGAQRQIVRLKNGVMLVYTADSPARISAVQAAVNSRGEHLVRFASAGEHARLCAECKAIRAELASGKLTREVVNIEGGSLTLLTSSDPTIVSRIHAMTDQKVAARIKS